MSGASSGDSERSSSGDETGMACDFCGRIVPRVRRVALDQGYERLQTPHRVRYACLDCSEEKDRLRREVSEG
jgi:hypothetical protein